MNSQTLITIAAIAIPSLITILAAYWQVRTMRAIANPSQFQPKHRIRNATNLVVDRVKNIGYFLLSILITLIPLVSELSKSDPPTRFSILIIALCVSLIILNLATILVFSVYRKLFKDSE